MREPEIEAFLTMLATERKVSASTHKQALSAVRRLYNQSMSRLHLENHQTDRVGWLRASVLGANDGIVSTASLIAGVAAAGVSPSQIVMTGVAALIAGALSMAAGEYVSVQAQADTEAADLAKERHELATDPAHEHAELAAIYQSRGLDVATAQTVATQLMAHDALGAHARDELGISHALKARPIQAALSSAAAFSVGAAVPLLVVLALMQLGQSASIGIATSAVSLVCLAALGAVSAWLGGAKPWPATLRMTVWGGLAMGLTHAVGFVFHV
jgi:VIT1/CCC1 family predicted Fe2+/Mn2+ transporter